MKRWNVRIMIVTEDDWTERDVICSMKRIVSSREEKQSIKVTPVKTVVSNRPEDVVE